MSNLIKLILFVCFVCFVLLAGPLCVIWAVNYFIQAAMIGAPAGAFIPHIAFEFYSWLAAVILGGMSILPSVRRS